jgi:hypothetical protein
MRRWAESPGDFIYVSSRKRLSLAAQLDISTGSWGPDVEVEAGTGIEAGVPPAKVAAEGSLRAVRSDPGRSQKDIARQLDQIVKRLEKKGLPNLENGEGEVREGGWFRFHRRLRFGVGHADAMPEHKALILVDESPVPEGLAVPGLLMNGSVAHLLEPYAIEELRNSPGSRSGSGSDYLFIWLEDARRALEENPEVNLGKVTPRYLSSYRPLRDPQVAVEMYGGYALEEPKTDDPPSFPRLFAAGPCEGVAQAFYIATTEETTVVMGSPLYVRFCAIPEQRERSWLGRLLRPT